MLSLAVMEFEGNDQRNLVRTLSGRLDDLLPQQRAAAAAGGGGGSPSAEESRKPSVNEEVGARLSKKTKGGLR